MIFNGHSHVTGEKGFLLPEGHIKFIIKKKKMFFFEKEQKIQSVNRRMKYLMVGWGKKMRVEFGLK